MSPRSDTCKRYTINAILGLQHMFAMIGAAFVVPILTGLSPSIALISAGCGTIIFHFCAKRKVPVFLGSSSAFVTAMLAIAKYGAERGMDHDHIMGRQMVGVIMSGVMYFVFALIAFLCGAERVKKLFPPVVVGPIIVVIGMTLAPTVISSNIVSKYAVAADGSQQMKDYEAWIIAMVTATTMVCVSVFARGIWKMLPVLFGVIAGYIVSAAFQVIDYTKITKAYWIIFQPEAFKESFRFYKYLAWDWNVVLMIAPISIVTFMEHIGDITTNSAVVGKDFFADPGLHCTLFGDGVAVCLAGFLGGPPVTTYGENTGVLAMTKNYNPKILVIAACYAVCLGVISKFGGVLGSVPGPVIGGASMVMFGMVASMGLKVLVDNHVDYTQTKNLVITALILVIGLGFSGGGVDAHIKDVSISSLALATVAGILLNVVLPNPKTPKSDAEEREGEKKGTESQIDAGLNISSTSQDDTSVTERQTTSSTSSDGDQVQELESEEDQPLEV